MEVTRLNLLWYNQGNLSRWDEYFHFLETTVWQLSNILPNLLKVDVSGTALTVELVSTCSTIVLISVA